MRSLIEKKSNTQYAVENYQHALLAFLSTVPINSNVISTAVTFSCLATLSHECGRNYEAKLQCNTESAKSAMHNIGGRWYFLCVAIGSPNKWPFTFSPPVCL
jgi:hypothetical protein